MCCAKNLNGHPRYVSSALTDHVRGSCGPTLPWNSGESAGARSRLLAAQWSSYAADRGAPANISSIATRETGLSGWSAGMSTVQDADEVNKHGHGGGDHGHCQLLGV